MTIGSERVVLDSNVWIFGLRRQPDRSACAELLDQLPRLRVCLPRQILRELQANLTNEELHDLFRLLSRYPDRIDVQWERVRDEQIQKYLDLGCKLGDAVVAAHVEVLNIRVLVSENRDFLEEIQGLPFRVLTASEALAELKEQAA